MNDHLQTLDPDLQRALTRIDIDLRRQFKMDSEQTAVGLIDLETGRVAMLRGDVVHYAASVPKIVILLAFFAKNPSAVDALDETTRQELGLMIKHSSNELAAKYSQLVGLAFLRELVTSEQYKLYDEMSGGGLWCGKHYSKDTERYPDPVGDCSHAATVRQVLRYYLMLERGELVDQKTSDIIREIFQSPQLSHLDGKFIDGLKGRQREVLRKSGTWENWFHDSAIVSGEGRRYILAALTHHPKGDEYLAELARKVDDLLAPAP